MEDPKPESLSPVQAVAIAGAIKETQEKAAKATLKNGSTARVDFICRIAGTIQRGAGSPESRSTSPAVVSLDTVPVFCAVLRALKITRRRFANALLAIDPAVAPDEEFDAVFADAEAKHASQLPNVESVRPASMGIVTSDITVTLC